MVDIIINDDAQSGHSPKHKTLPSANDGLLNLLYCLGYPLQSPPLGHLLQSLYQLPGPCLALTPIRWEASHNDVQIVADASSLHLSEDDSYALFKNMLPFFAEEGLSLHYHSAKTWFLQCPNKPSLTSLPAHLLFHRSLMPVFETLSDSFYWQRLLTEIQMYLNSLELAQKISINGLWLYGQGSLLEKHPAVISDDEGLNHCFPHGFTPFSDGVSFKKNSIVFLKKAESEQLMGLQNQLKSYSCRWFWNNIAYQTSPTPWWRRVAIPGITK